MNIMYNDGIMNSSLPLSTRASRVGKMYGSAVLIRMALEQLRQSPGNVWEDAFLDNIPVLGSSVRFGGPGVISTITRLLQAKSPRSIARGTTLLFGPKGSFQVIKTYEGIQATLRNGAVRNKEGDVIFQYSVEDIPEVLRSAIFSPSATKAGAEYYNQLFPGTIPSLIKAFSRDVV
jgi:hypothetical protein